MLIGLLGDLHGRVFRALAVLDRWQREQGRRFDLIIQVGDVGVFPDLARLDTATQRFAAEDAAELGFHRLLTADGELAGRLRRLRQQLAGPICFIHGNHDDVVWLRQAPHGVVDPFDLFRYVPDGTVTEIEDATIAFLGGVETEATRAEALNQEAYTRLMAWDRIPIDLLVTHDAPYGVAVGYRGNTQGSPAITALIDRVQPRFHVAGHYHHVHGPHQYGATVSYGLDILVAPVRRDPERRVQPGSLAFLDTARGTFELITDPWLADIGPAFD